MKRYRICKVPSVYRDKFIYVVEQRHWLYGWEKVDEHINLDYAREALVAEMGLRNRQATTVEEYRL